MFDFFLTNFDIEYLFRIFLSLICGFLLGFERKKHRHVVGIRTLVLICVSSSLLSILSIFMAEVPAVPGDPTRIAAGVITGIGFIGGGAILRQGLNIRGLTTAAIIFATAGIGLSCGAGLYIPTILTLVITLIILFFIDKFERRVFPAEKTKCLHLKFADTDIDEKQIHSILEEYGLVIFDVSVDYSVKKGNVELTYLLKCPDTLNHFKLVNRLSKVNKLEDFSICDK